MFWLRPWLKIFILSGNFVVSDNQSHQDGDSARVPSPPGALNFPIVFHTLEAFAKAIFLCLYVNWAIAFWGAGFETDALLLSSKTLNRLPHIVFRHMFLLSRLKVEVEGSLHPQASRARHKESRNLFRQIKIYLLFNHLKLQTKFE